MLARQTYENIPERKETMQSDTMRLEKNYLPAAGHDWALPLYDPLVKLFGAEAAKRTLVDQAAPYARVFFYL
jgi:hypothetical protein